MIFELRQEKLLTLMLISVAAGVILGIIYDALRILRKSRNFSRKILKIVDVLLISVEDILFFVFAGCVTSIIFYVCNYGKVRIFTFVFEIIGFTAYRLTLSRLIMSVADKIIKLVKKTGVLIFRKLIYPVFNLLRSVVLKIASVIKISRRKKYTESVMKKALKSAEKGFS